jgi:hypothetical protein
MQKVLLPVVFIGCVMQIVPPVPGQDTGASGNSSDKVTQQRQRDQSPTNPPSTVRPGQNTVEPGNNGQGITPQNEEQSVKLTSIPPIAIVEKQKTMSDHVFDWGPWLFNLLLVIVGVGAICVAHWTRVAIERQAKLMDGQAGLMEKQATLISRQTDLMQAAFDQWIEFRDWFAYAPQENVVRIEVFMVNPTDFPIHVTDGRITIRDTGGSVRSEMPEPSFLSPKQPHRFDIPTRITDEEAKRGFRFRVTVEFSYLHRITKEKQIRNFDGYISGRFGPNGRWSSDYEPWNQLNVENRDPQYQRPN